MLGFTNGNLRVLDALTLKDEIEIPFAFGRKPITHIVFDADCCFMATGVCYIGFNMS